MRVGVRGKFGGSMLIKGVVGWTLSWSIEIKISFVYSLSCIRCT